MTHHDQIDQRDGVEGNVPEDHARGHTHKDGGDSEHNRCGRQQVEAQQDEGHCADGQHRDAQLDQRLSHNGHVLLVEDVEDAAMEESMKHQAQ